MNLVQAFQGGGVGFFKPGVHTVEARLFHAKAIRKEDGLWQMGLH